MSRRPLGFVILALPLGALTVMMSILLIVDAPRAFSGREVLINLLLIAWTTLAGTTAVALWRVERWAGKALAWTVGVPLALMALSLMAGGAPGGASGLLIAALVAAAVLVYVRLRLAARHAPTTAARAAARRRWS
jgi:hypothetical protein